MARKEYGKLPWSLSRRFRGPAVWSKDKRSNAGQCTKILSRCLAVIEMAFAAVYSVVHAARRRQKGFDLAANFLGENGAGGKAKGVSEERATCNPPFVLFSDYFVCTRDFIRGDTNGFMVAKGAANRKTPHLPGKHAYALISDNSYGNTVCEKYVSIARAFDCIFIYKIEKLARESSLNNFKINSKLFIIFLCKMHYIYKI